MAEEKIIQILKLKSGAKKNLQKDKKKIIQKSFFELELWGCLVLDSMILNYESNCSVPSHKSLYFSLNFYTITYSKGHSGIHVERINS